MKPQRKNDERIGDAARSRRIFRIALLGSIVVHLLGYLSYANIVRLLVPHLPKPPEVVTQDPFVQTSTALTLDKRPIPRPAPQPPHAAHLSRPAPRAVAVAPAPAPAPPAPKPDLQSANVTPAPVQATAKPQPVRHTTIEVAQAHPRSEEPITRAELERLQNEFSQTIAESRSNPLKVPKQTPAAPKHVAIDFEGRITDLKHGQGYLQPLQSWHRGGYTYYYVHYEYMYPNGTFEEGDVPWPIRYTSAEDPFTKPPSVFPLPPPLPDFVLPPGIKLGKVLRSYFPDRYPQG